MSGAIMRAERAGAPLLAALHACAFPADPWDADAFAALLAMPGAFALIAAEDATPAGFVLARIAADEAEIVTLGVVPRARRRGHGTRLAAAAAAEAQARGAGRLFLEVAAGNAAARRLYGRLGFREVGQRRGYYPDGADALVLALALSPPS
ncbi:ribosomal protein S18-alanine N-acetyltransferase [Elioraea sp.]|uniref:ribosomal protein S18-alanine N-acetyltransferase n=1 Tax=Elioraea sp. TaxID=2185103 RepID=UPI0027E4B439|nr:ribosomal protein S18-alanine N-acetyltransferase [Elioraea sp.]